MRKIFGVGAVLLALTACGLDEDDLPAAYADAFCDRLLECDQGQFESEFSDMDDCEDEITEGGEDLQDIIDDGDGEYSSEGARECIASIREVSCEDFEDFEFLVDCEQGDIYP